jgi:hypothetical protein
MGLSKTGGQGENWINLAHNGNQQQVLVRGSSVFQFAIQKYKD